MSEPYWWPKKRIYQETYKGADIYYDPEVELYWTPFTYSLSLIWTDLDSLKGNIDREVERLKEEVPTPPEEVPPEVPEVPTPPELLPPEEVPPEVPPEEVPPVEVPEPFAMPGLPWYVSWLKPVLQFIGKLTEAVVNFFAPIFEPLGTIASNVFDIPGKIVEGFITGIGSIIGGARDKGADVAVSTVTEITAGTPPWMLSFQAEVEKMYSPIVAGYNEALDVETYEKSPLAGEDAVKALQDLKGKVLSVAITNFVLNALIESGSLGQFEWMKELDPIVTSKLGMNRLIERATMLPIEKAVLIPAEYEWSSRHPNLIPTYADLINMVVKEVIPIDRFKGEMRKLGYNEEFSQFIWDAHFIPPTLTDLVTAWRRGIIDETRLDELIILVDLDPRFKEIFDTRKYVDPTLRAGRYMYEAGAIDEARLTNIVHRQGYNPEDTEAIVGYLTTFQERIFRTQYLRAVATGVVYGAYTEDELKAEVTEAGYSEDVAEWMLKAGEARARTARVRAKAPKPKLLSLGNLKKAYVIDEVDEDYMRRELLLMGYEAEEVDILLALLDSEKVTQEAGGRKLSLTQAELLNAWKYGEVDEDYVRTELQLRGLPFDETELLISTKKKQWG